MIAANKVFLAFNIGGWCNGSGLDASYTKLITDFCLKQVKKERRSRPAFKVKK